MGKLILLANIPDRYTTTIKQAIKFNQPIWNAEKRYLGFTHAEVGGAYLFSIWGGLPEELINAILYHHTPPSLSQDVTMTPPLLPLHIANVIEHNMINYGNPHARREFDYVFLERFGLNNDVEGMIDECRQVCVEVGVNE